MPGIVKSCRINSGLSIHLLRALFISSFLSLLLPLSCYTQELKVRTQNAPFYVGDRIAIEVDAIDFDFEPEIKVQNTDLPNINFAFKDSARSQSSESFQIGNQIVRNTITKTTYRYLVEFSKAGTYKIGPFETEVNGKKYSRRAIAFEVSDIEVDPDMKVEISIPPGDKYPGQRVPVTLTWQYAGDLNTIANVTIRSPLFDQFRFLDKPTNARQNAIPISTRNGIQRFPAKFTESSIDGKRIVVGTVHRTMVPENPGKATLPATFVSFRKVVGYRRSRDFFSLFDEQAVTVPKKGIGSPVSFEVKPFPNQGKPQNFAGAVGTDFQINTSMSRTRIRVGDPLTLQIDLTGSGNIEAIGLPDFSSEFSPEKFDWPDGDAAGATDGSQKQFKIAFRIKDESVTEIPALSFSWFDPNQQTYLTARSNPIPVTVKPGELVSSTDVIRNKTDVTESDLTQTTQADWSIETETKRLVREKHSSTSRTDWILYTIGIVVVAYAIFDRNRKKTVPVATSQRNSVREICGKIRLLSPEENSIARLANLLRQLLVLLEESGPEQNQPGKTREIIDELVGQCDSLSFRPTTPAVEEQVELINAARDIIKKL